MLTFLSISSTLFAVNLIECNKVDVKFVSYFYVQTGIDLLNIKQQTGIQALTVAFALAQVGGSCTPSFNTVPVDSPVLVQQFNNFRNSNGQIILSTGGAIGTYLDNVCSNSDNLADAYIKAIQATGAVGLDLDIEQDIPYDMVMQAVKMVQQQLIGLTVSITVASNENGLGARAKLVIQAAQRSGTTIDLVNTMAMDFPKSPLTPTYGQAVVNCAESVKHQLQQYWPQKSSGQLYGMLGVTPMIGVNDCCDGALFTLNDSQLLLQYARTNRIGRLSLWSLNRDKQCPGGSRQLSPTCSGIQQSNYEFAKILGQFK
ncbi:chitinase-like [Oppia nitens]|uniref:chitinase-like n=1 Tax=Oppia nitens TaxID=1686743 RepID=UPI0023D9E3D0|nr:chitinase-like [Oppia nitens]